MNYTLIEDRIEPIRVMLEAMQPKVGTEGIDILYQLILIACDEAYIAWEISANNKQ